MSKGYKPTDNNRPHVVTVDRESEVITDTGETCWQFELQDKTPFLGTISIGLPVIGSIHENRVLVRGDNRALGFAPSDIALEIIHVAIARKGKLSGSVLSVSENSDVSNESDIWVELCLK